MPSSSSKSEGKGKEGKEDQGDGSLSCPLGYVGYFAGHLVGPQVPRAFQLAKDGSNNDLLAHPGS